jgi:hypothetical protein
VGDDVVQILRNTHTFLGDSPLRFFVAFPFELLGALLELLGVQPPIAHACPKEVRGREQHVIEDDARKVESGRIRCRDNHQADRDDRGPDEPFTSR